MNKEQLMSAIASEPYGAIQGVRIEFLREIYPEPERQPPMAEFLQVVLDASSGKHETVKYDPVKLFMAELGPEYTLIQDHHQNPHEIMFIRLIEFCPKCNGRGFYRVHPPVYPRVVPAEEFEVPGNGHFVYEDIECDHKPD